LRRLFSSFARGWPGVALLLMRFVAAIALANQGILQLSSAPSNRALLSSLLFVALAVLFIAGLWTPVAGGLVALVELWKAWSRPPDIWLYILLATLGVALALLGPGAWSVDARLFGWKRIGIRDRKS
jgi:putative oxidoreductase